MALSRAAARGGLWRLGPSALSPPRERMQPQLALGVPRSQVRSRSSRAASRALVAAVVAAAQRVNASFEQYLQRSFPRFYLLHSTFKTGIQALFLEVKEIGKIKSRMRRQRLSARQLPYRDMERLRQAVPQGRAQGHSHRDHRHPALRQFPGHCLDVFLPTAAPDPPLLDSQAAAGVPGRLRPRAPALVPRRAARPGAGGAGPAPAPAPGAPAAALRSGAGRRPAGPGAAPGREEFLLRLRAGVERAPGGARESPEPRALPHPALPGLPPAAPPAQPRPGDPAPGPRPAAPGPGPALRGGAASGLLPAWAEPHSAGPGRVPSVAGAVAPALLRAPSL
ncbi:basic proline-rich protein-like isoform X3 [Hirundo rustica]|uniref:basic proline-rich protein-like isoform X3 n=1 Tax=Hirundo rustica TaxID=43150 RepID=UPI001A93D6D2|nr:basic proline-rich protein-like isoform X3 [Hirundo rustica]